MTGRAACREELLVGRNFLSGGAPRRESIYFALTKYRRVRSIVHMPVSNRDVRLVQVAYPQIYFACHTRHVRRASTTTQLSAADSTLLAHLDEDEAVRPTALAKHLGLAASTLSAAIARLVALGYVVQRQDGKDRRAIDLHLSSKGAEAMQASSVLDSRRVARMLNKLTLAERRRALDGLALLGKAARLPHERGEVYNVFFRALSKFVFGHTATMDSCLSALGKKLST